MSSAALTTASKQAGDAAFAAARDICRRHARSFYFASHFLAAPKRRAAYAVYAFCRLIDDAIDVPEAPDAKAAPGEPGRENEHISADLSGRFDRLREQLDQIYEDRLPPADSGQPDQLALHAFGQTVRDYEIPKQYFLDIAEGCRMDLTISRYATWAELENYCYHVAGVVGLVMSQIFGLRREDARRQAVQMGNAMQLTNILRDVKEDFDRGRIYLPKEDLDRFGYRESDLAAGIVDDRFRALMKFEIARARALFDVGAEGLCWLDGQSSRLTASAMGVIYAGILSAIEANRYDVFSSRARLSGLQKIARLPGAWRLARRRDGSPLPEVF